MSRQCLPWKFSCGWTRSASDLPKEKRKSYTSQVKEFEEWEKEVKRQTIIKCCKLARLFVEDLNLEGIYWLGISHEKREVCILCSMESEEYVALARARVLQTCHGIPIVVKLHEKDQISRMDGM